MNKDKNNSKNNNNDIGSIGLTLLACTLGIVVPFAMGCCLASGWITPGVFNKVSAFGAIAGALIIVYLVMKYGNKD